MKPILLALNGLFLLLFQQINAQENLMPGYIITLNDERVEGQIDYKNWNRNPKKISFLKTGSSQKQTYASLDIKAFGVADEKYKGATIEREISAIMANKMDFESAQKTTPDTVFLQVLVEGSKSLLHYKSTGEKDQFYIQNEDEMELLVYKKYLKEVEGNDLMAENNAFRGQLIVYLNDCVELVDKIATTKYKKTPLQKLFLSYYKCKNEQPTFQKVPEKTKTEFGALAAFSATNLAFSTEDWTYRHLSEASFSNAYGMELGLSVNFILPRNRGKWSIANEFTWSSYSVSGKFDDIISSGHQVYHQSSLEYSYAKMNNMLRYRQPLKKGLFFVNAGISNGIVLSEKNQYQKRTVFYSSDVLLEDVPLAETRKHEQGFLLGAGIRLKAFSLELRHERASGMSAYSALNSRVLRNSVRVGYAFN